MHPAKKVLEDYLGSDKTVAYDENQGSKPESVAEGFKKLFPTTEEDEETKKSVS